MVSLISQIVLMIRDIASSAGMIALYIVFLLIEYQFFDQKLEALFQNETSRKKTLEVIHKIGSQVRAYLRIKTTLSLVTALLSYFVLKTVGVPFADFWALLIFLLNFIPTIGSIVSTIFPCLVTLLQFDQILPFVLVLGGLLAIQFTIGNIIEPRIVGKRFNLSGFIILLSLTIWGQLWGVLGMIICVPFLMIANIILMNFPKTRPIAILLSQNGNID